METKWIIERKTFNRCSKKEYNDFNEAGEDMKRIAQKDKSGRTIKDYRLRGIRED